MEKVANSWNFAKNNLGTIKIFSTHIPNINAIWQVKWPWLEICMFENEKVCVTIVFCEISTVGDFFHRDRELIFLRRIKHLFNRISNFSLLWLVKWTNLGIFFVRKWKNGRENCVFQISVDFFHWHPVSIFFKDN